MAKIKTQIALTKPQFEFLSTEADRLGTNIADICRRVLDEHIARNVAR